MTAPHAQTEIPVKFVIDRITPSFKAAAKSAGSWCAAAGELLQVEPTPSPNAQTNERSRIAAARIFGKTNNRPTSAGLFFFAFWRFFVASARMQSHLLQHKTVRQARKKLCPDSTLIEVENREGDRRLTLKYQTTGFPKHWPSERNRKDHADAVAALAGNGHQVNATRAASNTVACKNFPFCCRCFFGLVAAHALSRAPRDTWQYQQV